MSHNPPVPYTTQSNARYNSMAASSFYNNASFTKPLNVSLLSSNTSFNGGSSMLYPKSKLSSNQSQKIISRITWNDTFSIPIACGTPKCNENPDLELWKNPHYTKLKSSNNRRIVCGGLFWNIYIHPNQGENGDEFALSVFPVYTPNDINNKLPENYKLNYKILTRVNINSIGTNNNNDEKQQELLDNKFNNEFNYCLDNDKIISISEIENDRQLLLLFNNKQKLSFSIKDLNYSQIYDDDYFNLNIIIKINFIKKQNKRSLYYGVLGSILIEYELLVKEKENEITKLKNNKDKHVLNLQNQLTESNKLKQAMQLNINTFSIQLRELTNEIKNISSNTMNKEKRILHLQNDINNKNNQIDELNHKIIRLQQQIQDKNLNNNNNSINQILSLLTQTQLQTQVQPHSHLPIPIQPQLLQQQQQQQFNQQLFQQSNIENPNNNPFSSVASNQNNNNNNNIINQQQQQPQPSQYHQARVINQPAFNEYQMHQPQLQPEPQLNIPDLEIHSEKEKQQQQQEQEQLQQFQEQQQQPFQQSNIDINNNQNNNQNNNEQEQEQFIEDAYTINDSIDQTNDELKFEHRPIRAWRWDVDQTKWRGRGKGQIKIIYDQRTELGRLIFRDEKHDKTRLLQYINGKDQNNNDIDNGNTLCTFINDTPHNNTSINNSPINNEVSIEWTGADYTMDLKEPMIGKWKLSFGGDDNNTISQQFVSIFNQFIKQSNDSNNNNNNNNDSTKPFESWLNTSPINVGGAASWVNAFGQSDDNNNNDDNDNGNNGSFENISWEIQDNNNSLLFNNNKEEQEQEQEQPQEQITNNNNNNNEEDNGNFTLKPIVELEETKVDTGHENETLLISLNFSKLYRFGKDVTNEPTWKIRATSSTICFYKSNMNKKIRIIAREQETNKLRMNQFIPNKNNASFNLKKINVYSWIAFDATIAEENANRENNNNGLSTWCVKFQNQEQSQQFENYFTDAMENNEQISSQLSPIKDIQIQQPQPQQEQQPEPQQPEPEPQQNEINNEINNEIDSKYDGWTAEEIATDKKRIETGKQNEETAKAFLSSDNNNSNEISSWNMDPFSTENNNETVQNLFSIPSFDGGRGVDLDAERQQETISNDPSLKWGVNDNSHDNSSEQISQNFSNVTTRDTSTNNSGLGFDNFAFDANEKEENDKKEEEEQQEQQEQQVQVQEQEQEEENGKSTSWDIGGGGFSSVAVQQGFGNAQWGVNNDNDNNNNNNNNNNGFGSFSNDTSEFNFDSIISKEPRDNTESQIQEQKQTVNNNNNDNNNNNNNNVDDNGNFTLKPIVNLEEVEVATGHENEEELKKFEISKLYRWGKDVAQQPCWKNRASSTSLLFYQNKNTGKIRLICRENITNKLRLNQNVAPKNVANIENKREKQIGWSGFDVTIEEEDNAGNNGFCMFAAKFADKDIAKEFYDFFVTSSENNEQLAN